MLKRSIIIIFFFFFVKLFFTGAKRSHLQKIKHIWLLSFSLLSVLMLDDVPCCNRHQTHSNIKANVTFVVVLKAVIGSDSDRVYFGIKLDWIHQSILLTIFLKVFTIKLKQSVTV